MTGKKLYYGWINLIIVWIINFISIVPFFYSFGIVAEQMSSSMNISMTVATGAYTLNTVVFAIIAPLHGRFVDRFNIKTSMALGFAFGTLGYAALACLSRSVAVYYLVWIVPMSIYLRFGGAYASQIILSKWFFRHRGLAISLISVAGGLGGYVFNPLFESLLSRFGWQRVWLFLAVTSGVGFLLTLFFLRADPTEDDPELHEDEKIVHRSFRTTDSWSCREVLKNYRFYLIIVILTLSQFIMYSICNTGVQYLIDSGMDGAEAAAKVGSFALISVIGRLFMGCMIDRTSGRIPLMAGCLMAGAGMMMLRDVDPSTINAALALAALGYGIIISSPSPMLLAKASCTLGKKSMRTS